MKYYKLKMDDESYRYCAAHNNGDLPFFYYRSYNKDTAKWVLSTTLWSTYLTLFEPMEIVEVSKLEVLVVTGSVPE